MKKILLNLYNKIFKRNKQYIVWNESSAYDIVWSDHAPSRGVFFYQIIYFPYKNNKYKITYNPEYITHYPMKKRHATEHPFYGIVVNKLALFQQEDLLNLIKLPEIKGINKSV